MKTQHLLIVCIIGMSLMTGMLAYHKTFNAVEQPVIERPELPVVPPKPEEEKPVPTFEEALASINAEELKKHVVWLADDAREGRQSGEPGGDAARDYIKKEFESYGLPTMFDEFRVRTGDGSAENVYAWIEGTSHADEVVVVGAHYDHIGKNRMGEVNNGADDNASGTAAVLAMAKALAPLKGQIKRTVVFQLYSGEELGLVGSSHYASNPKFPKGGPSIDKHIFMENLDMIGYGKFDTRIFQRVETDPVGTLVQQLTETYPFAARVTQRGGSGSDHAPFRRKGVPCVFLHTGLHANYHKPSDDADKLNYKSMELVTRYGLDLLWQVCQNGMPRVVAKNVQEEPEIMLDHGKEPFLN